MLEKKDVNLKQNLDCWIVWIMHFTSLQGNEASPHCVFPILIDSIEKRIFYALRQY